MPAIINVILIGACATIIVRIAETFHLLLLTPRRPKKPWLHKLSAVLFWSACLAAIFLLVYLGNTDNNYVIHVRLSDGSEAPSGVRLRNDQDGAAETLDHGEINPGLYPPLWLRHDKPVRLFGSYCGFSFLTEVVGDRNGYTITLPFDARQAMELQRQNRLETQPLGIVREPSASAPGTI